MTEQILAAIDKLSGLDESDAAALADAIVDAAIDVLMADKTLPKRTAFEWWLVLTKVHALASEKITSRIYDHVDRADALNAVEWEG